MTLCGLIIWKSKQHGADMMFQTDQPQITDIEVKRLIPGNLYPLKEIEIKSAVSGTFQQVFVSIGQEVKTGDVIAQIKRVPNPADLEIAKKNLNAAKINLDIDERQYMRYKQLFDNKVISASDFDNYVKVFELSKEQLSSAENQLTLLQKGYVENSEISNKIVATTDGTIIDLPLKEGASVIERNNFNDGTTIAVIARLDSFMFKGKVNEGDLMYLKKGKNLRLNINAYKNVVGNATITKISEKGAEEQGVMKYYIEATFSLKGDSLVLRSGFTANAEILLQKKSKVLAIEEKNLQFDNDSAYLEVLGKDNKFEKKYVETGVSDGIKIEIIKGLKLNEKFKVVDY